ncbi:hypothetical protein [Bacillus coahuilensis]|nr:hypothetical protein [Bacillus coahuilensis]
MIKVVAKNFVKEGQTELFLERINDLIVETLKKKGAFPMNYSRM